MRTGPIEPVPTLIRAVAAPVLAVLAVLAAGCAADDATGQTTTPTVDASSAARIDTTSPTGEQPLTGSDTPRTAAGVTTARAFEVEPADWTGCGDGFECAEVAVPLDHERPDGPTIDLALVRVPATDGEAAVGSILVNPGGPGGSGIGYVRSGFRFDEETMRHHHLVGFDPRGIGASRALGCGGDPPDGPLPDYEPDDEAERAALDDFAIELAERCRSTDGELLPHIGTDSVVADLDLLRQAVGDERLSFLGFSYGTLIGLRYAERYPDRVGRMILDGVVDPASTLVGLLTQQAEGFDRVFAEADQGCGSSLDCPAGGLAVAYDRVAERLDTEGPIEGVGPTELAMGTILALYAEHLWPRYARALDDADRGQVDGIRSLYRFYAEAADQAAYNAVTCTDTPVPAGSEAWDRFADQLAERSPRFGAILANEVRACAHWPVRATTAPEAVSPEGIPPILVLSTTGDAATPLTNAITVAAALDGAGLVTVEDTSHTAYGRNFCVERIVAEYLRSGEVPDTVHRC